jgi:hypothetical protein
MEHIAVLLPPNNTNNHPKQPDISTPTHPMTTLTTTADIPDLINDINNPGLLVDPDSMDLTLDASLSNSPANKKTKPKCSGPGTRWFCSTS